MIAVFVNCAAVIAGSLIGILFIGKKNDELSSIVCSASGVVTLVIGFKMAFEYESIIYVTLSLILGGLLGSKIDIDGKILDFGRFLEKKLYHKKLAAFSAGKSEYLVQDTPPAGEIKPTFAYAFLNASVLFCVGAMAILGSFQAGLNKDYTLIFTKSVLDGFMAIVFTAAMGIGTAFSAIPILLYQGTLTLASTFVAPFVSDQMLTELTSVGGCLIIMIGINLLGLTKLKTANYLPSIALIVVFILLDKYIRILA